jgi:hypothetical protein
MKLNLDKELDAAKTLKDSTKDLIHLETNFETKKINTLVA